MPALSREKAIELVERSAIRLQDVQETLEVSIDPDVQLSESVLNDIEIVRAFLTNYKEQAQYTLKK